MCHHQARVKVYSRLPGCQFSLTAQIKTQSSTTLEEQTKLGFILFLGVSDGEKYSQTIVEVIPYLAVALAGPGWLLGLCSQAGFLAKVAKLRTAEEAFSCPPEEGSRVPRPRLNRMKHKSTTRGRQ